ncbi:glycosyltransferase family 2 protein [Hydrogenophaga sp. 5NK40-0174]|uniref:glycosyltransferase family 2 protein n=1 Tax=Hydrogenophaga sp. 5NK40-0174 TaxID=3127649 RepID=UPI003109CFBA
MKPSSVSVIFTTYNSPAWLEKVLWGFFAQDTKAFEIVVADDGSTIETRALLDRMRKISPVPIRHVWQEDDGFQKCRILNKAIAAATGEYLIFTDGDCIPRADFISQHLRFAAPGRFLSGGYFKLPLDISQAITEEDVKAQRPFDLAWLKSLGLKASIKNLKISAKGRWADWLNAVSRTKATWNGHNASCHKEAIVAVNGFDERMQYGGQDVEFGDRLTHHGLKGLRIRYSVICVHLDHGRGYVTDEMLRHSLSIRQATRASRVVRAPLGLDQYL